MAESFRTGDISASSRTDSSPPVKGKSRPRWMPAKISCLVFVAMIAVAVVPFVVTQNMVETQDSDALDQRAEDAQQRTAAVLMQVRSSIRQIAAAIQTNSSSASFHQTAGAVVQQGGASAIALLDIKSSPAKVLQLEGNAPGLTLGQPVGANVARATSAITLDLTFASTPVMFVGEQRHIGLAQGPPLSPAGMAIYVDIPLRTFDPISISSLFGTTTDVDYALYAVPQIDQNQLMYASTQELPLKGKQATESVVAGSSNWLLVVRERHTLVDPLLKDLPWIIFGAGLLLAFAIAGIVEVNSRRRDYALALVDERTDELQQSLTQLRETQERLVHQERLAAIGELASTVGHELRNPLGVVTNALYLVRLGVGEGEERIQKHLRTAEREVASATLIVSDLLDFAREREPMMSRVDLTELIDETLSVVPPPDGITVEVEHPDKTPLIEADRDQLRQVLLNLVSNAYEAMPDGGRLRVGVAAQDGFVITSVTDTGSGMSEDVKAHLFEPFFTQKMRGVGLGLTVTKRIIDAHHGVIDVRSAPGEGTSFSVRLPVDEKEAVIA